MVVGWPLFDLIIKTPVLELRIPTDNEVFELLDLARQGIHPSGYMPFNTAWTERSEPDFSANYLQHHWRSRAELSPEKWDLNFIVRKDGKVVGSQSIGAEE